MSNNTNNTKDNSNKGSQGNSLSYEKRSINESGTTKMKQSTSERPPRR